MAECHFWWRAGETQWCDMVGNSCRCGGWEESCDLKSVSHRSRAKLIAQVDPEAAEKKITHRRKPKRAA